MILLISSYYLFYLFGIESIRVFLSCLFLEKIIKDVKLNFLFFTYIILFGRFVL